MALAAAQAASPAAAQAASPAEAIEDAAGVVEWATGPGAAPGVAVSLADLELLAPIPRPPSLRDALTFETHVVNSFRKGTLGRLAPLDALLERALGGRRSLTHLLTRGFYAQPPYYNASAAATVGSGTTVCIPRYCEVFDYELEWAVVIGREGADIPAGKAREHIAGYTVFNDVTARALQRADQERKHPWFRSKSLDTFGPMGPYLVTADEVADPHALRLTLAVNDDMRQDDTTASMIYRISTLIVFLSKFFALEPGDVIATGTPSGIGPLVPGDVVEVSVEGLGTLRNPVVGIS